MRITILKIAAALLLVIPCAAAGVFAFHLNIGSANAQEPSSADKQKREMEERARMDQMKELREKEDQELKERIEKETNPEMKAKLEAILERRLEERAKSEYKIEGSAVVTVGEGWAREIGRASCRERV